MRRTSLAALCGAIVVLSACNAYDNGSGTGPQGGLLAAPTGISYELDPDDKTFTLKRMELNLHGLGKLETSFVIDGVKADDAANPAGAMPTFADVMIGNPAHVVR